MSNAAPGREGESYDPLAELNAQLADARAEIERLNKFNDNLMHQEVNDLQKIARYEAVVEAARKLRRQPHLYANTDELDAALAALEQQ